ncbi:hypothetical protein K474DRAFT_1691494 [Panus rudis PR-1116 ss-1]|nr:hypothetical protein K474DRAFT_1691494 [Panus rudis PR-1116 ss-1]
MSDTRPNYISSTSLCLACSSSLPPRKSSDDPIFITSCCSRPICTNCLMANPRLARYNPCLRCLGGVGVVGSRSQQPAPPASGTAKDRNNIDDNVNPINIDGGIHDEDVFVLGDDDEETDELPPYSNNIDPSEDQQSASLATTTEPHASSASESNDEGTIADSSSSSGPTKYYIRPGDDTLVGIALKHHVDGRLLCRLNNLPPSTLRTTPHLLHTRTYLIFPPSAQPLESTPLSKAEEQEREARRARERAEKRFQTLTKEVNYDVAKVYVALAEHDGGEPSEASYEAKKEGLEMKGGSSSGVGDSTVEGRAIDRYLDDDEWEARERREGRAVAIPRFPLFRADSKGDVSRSSAWGLPSLWKK